MRLAALLWRLSTRHSRDQRACMRPQRCDSCSCSNARCVRARPSSCATTQPPAVDGAGCKWWYEQTRALRARRVRLSMVMPTVCSSCFVRRGGLQDQGQDQGQEQGLWPRPLMGATSAATFLRGCGRCAGCRSCRRGGCRGVLFGRAVLLAARDDARWAMHPRPSLALLSFAVLSLVLSSPR